LIARSIAFRGGNAFSSRAAGEKKGSFETPEPASAFDEAEGTGAAGARAADAAARERQNQ
jgi:hypothetical protein